MSHAHKESNVFTRLGKAASKVSSDCPAADNQYPHRIIISDRHAAAKTSCQGLAAFCRKLPAGRKIRETDGLGPNQTGDGEAPCVDDCLRMAGYISR
jgi:hypothetical protein